jgi:hypothetical protein
MFGQNEKKGVTDTCRKHGENKERRMQNGSLSRTKRTRSANTPPSGYTDKEEEFYKVNFYFPLISVPGSLREENIY